MPVDFYEWTQAMLISRVINCLLIVFPLVKLHTCTLLSTKVALLQGHFPSQFSNFSKILCVAKRKSIFSFHVYNQFKFNNKSIKIPDQSKRLLIWKTLTWYWDGVTNSSDQNIQCSKHPMQLQNVQSAAQTLTWLLEFVILFYHKKSKYLQTTLTNKQKWKCDRKQSLQNYN